MLLKSRSTLPAASALVNTNRILVLERGDRAGIAVGPLAHGFGAFAKTPLEKANRVCLQTAVDFIARQIPALHSHS